MFNKKGFTLIEILVAVSIIGFLTTIVLVSLNSAKEKAQETASIKQLDEVKKALAMFYADNGYYPEGDIKVLSSILSGNNNDNKIYIPKISENPRLFYIGLDCNFTDKCLNKSLVLWDKNIFDRVENYTIAEQICLSQSKRLPTTDEFTAHWILNGAYGSSDYFYGDNSGSNFVFRCVRE
jgi:prepilin-type N-terminal cleavage/methylation domain-containing protein